MAKQAKVDTARTLWVPAVNNHGGFGRWAFLEVKDPWDAKTLIRGFIDAQETKSKENGLIRHVPSICGGSARIRNTRIPVWTLVRFRQLGAPDEMILDNYPSLTKADLEGAWAYYDQNKEEVDREIFEQDQDS